MELLQLTYTPNPNGLAEYFHKYISIKNNIKQLKTGGKITDKQIMSAAKSAFLNLGHHKIYVVGINDCWTASKKTSRKDFCAHYDCKLKRLWEHGDCGVNEQAHHTKQLEGKMAAMQDTIDMLTAHLAEGKEANNATKTTVATKSHC